MEVERSFARGVTVDGPTSRDLDDAIFVEKRADGWLVEVSIADVTAHVSKGSDVDRRALQQAFTRYYARGNRPMLPRYLAEERLSLLPNRKRDTITFSMELDASLAVKNIDIRLSRLESTRRYAHADVDEILDTTGHDQHGWWSECFELALGLLGKRREQGALAVFDLKKGLMCDEEGNVKKMPSGQNFRAHLIVQELMILTNCAATAYLHAQGVPLLFRIHSSRPEKVRQHYVEQLARLLVEPTAEMLERLQKDCRQTMERARYSPTLSRHFALNVEAYAHLTSPIRRAADMVSHRMIVAWLRKEPMPYSHRELKEIGDHLNAVSDEVRDGKSDAMRDQQIERLTTMSIGTLRGLKYGDFRYFVEKLADETIPLDPPRASVVADWILDRSANVVDIARILFSKAPQDDCWALVKEAALQWLQNDPAQVTQVINMAHANCGTPSLDELTFVRNMTGKHPQEHLVSVSMTLGEREFSSETFTAKTIKEAEQRAVMNLLIAIAELPTPFVPRKKSTGVPGIVNPKGFLLERCVKLGISPPTIEEWGEGPRHAPTFTCTANIVFRSQSFTSGPQRGGSKKSAERDACNALLQRLPREFFEDASSAEDSVTSDSAKNPIGTLQEYAQARKLRPPEYSCVGAGPDHARVFKCTCTLHAGNGKKSWTGVGKTKGEAKADAAKGACTELKI